LPLFTSLESLQQKTKREAMPELNIRSSFIEHSKLQHSSLIIIIIIIIIIIT